ncbi:hypothetical protein C1H76_2412 [Elsinoe australis]|uniref:Uncharacterized protein n=1 Tax=Elsinoe australis TaxID=40998 RepID=A0A4V6DUN5_9PEZI|nr:hypothetical protein C1H76_2412 [Elsinoe australis]
MNSAWPRVLRESDYDRWLEETNSNEARIKDVKVAASYSWEVAEEGDNDNPTIVYPLDDEHVELDPDEGVVTRDTNLAAYQKHALEAPVHATLACELVDPSDIDLFIPAEVIDSIGDFFQSETGHSFVFQLIHNTVFVARNDGLDGDRPETYDLTGHGYDKGFVQNCCQFPESVANTTSHHRVITYKLGGLRLAVFFECDGYLLDEITGRARANLGNIDLSKNPRGNTDGLHVKQGGHLIPHSVLYDLNTRSGSSSNETDNEVVVERGAALWSRQLHNIIIAYHHVGEFHQEKIKRIDLVEDARYSYEGEFLSEYETRNQRRFVLLSRFLGEMVKYAHEESGGRRVMVVQKVGRSGMESVMEGDVGSEWELLSERLTDAWDQ